MPESRTRLTVAATWLCGIVMLMAQGCQTAQRPLNPNTIRAATITADEQQTALSRWRFAIDLANEFLASPFNRTLPSNAQLQLRDDGMQLLTTDRTMAIPLVLIDDYRTSSCICATVDTYRRVTYVFRPWGASTDLPITTCNTFFASMPSGADEPDVDLANQILRTATILFFEKHAHISTWEWFKCQWLEWLIGSGHHKFSMRKPNAVAKELFHFWHGMEPASPGIERILAGKPNSATLRQDRSRGVAAWQEAFEQYLRERESDDDGQ